ncbi:DUF58 domain-containing protein [Magnetospira sp. QH-2]|uniref:DUF58 domain-containing protein n=1 Tax=Magnetospira sp. (strain QH-2) TaxID=1288970 RepID=UPI0003E811BE|nr:DUF58 domain-containing protein [Magnetospira sp. QH-2]CCQ72732.1 conserved protein of unknown function [Magnetospira sp. QH-2]
MTDPLSPAIHRQAAHLGEELPPLLAAATRIADGVRAGLHGRRRAGPGESFWQYRPYQSGDSARRIDWRRSARSDDLFIREKEWQAAQTVLMWCDGSPSMDYRSTRNLPSKRERAGVLCLALALLLARGGERVGLLGEGEPTGGSRETLSQMALALDHGGPAMGDPRVRAGVMSHARVLLFGDLLTDPETLTRDLTELARRGGCGHLVVIRDPAEASLPFDGRYRVSGPENEGTLRVGRIQSLRPDYQTAVADQRATVEALVRDLGWTLTWHHTDRPVEPILLALYENLAAVPC